MYSQYIGIFSKISLKEVVDEYKSRIEEQPDYRSSPIGGMARRVSFFSL